MNENKMDDRERNIKTVEQAHAVTLAAWRVMRLVNASKWSFFWSKVTRDSIKSSFEGFEKTILEASQWHEHGCREGPERDNLAVALNLAEYIYHRYLPRGMK